MATQNPIELLVTLGINSNESRRNIQASINDLQRNLNLNVNANNSGSGGRSATSGIDSQLRALDRLNYELERTQRVYRNTFDATEAQRLSSVIDRLRNTPITNNDDLRNTSRQISDAQEALRRFRNDAVDSARATNTLGESLTKAFSRIGLYAGVSTVVYGIASGFQNLTERVIELDTALTDLRRVADLDEFTFNTVIERTIENVDNLSARTSDYIKIFNEFARTGQNDVDSFALANTATLLQNISELTADEAFSSLTAAMISFNIAAEDSVRIADRLNEVNVSAFLIRNFKVIKSNYIGENPEMGNT